MFTANSSGCLGAFLLTIKHKFYWNQRKIQLTTNLFDLINQTIDQIKEVANKDSLKM